MTTTNNRRPSRRRSVKAGTGIGTAGAFYHVPLTINVSEGPTQDHPSVLGELNFAILPRPAGQKVYRLFCGPNPLCFSLDHPAGDREYQGELRIAGCAPPPPPLDVRVLYAHSVRK